MNAGKALFQPVDQVDVVLKGKFRMQATYDVEFRDSFRPALSSLSEGLIECHRIRARHVRLAPEGAELATGHAHVCRVKVTIDVEIGELAVQFRADMVGKIT